jgi:hypothetical protein
LNNISEAILKYLAERAKVKNEIDGIHINVKLMAIDDVIKSLNEYQEQEILCNVSELNKLGYVYVDRSAIKLHSSGYEYYEENIKRRKIGF